MSTIMKQHEGESIINWEGYCSLFISVVLWVDLLCLFFHLWRMNQQDTMREVVVQRQDRVKPWIKAVTRNSQRTLKLVERKVDSTQKLLNMKNTQFPDSCWGPAAYAIAIIRGPLGLRRSREQGREKDQK